MKRQGRLVVILLGGPGAGKGTQAQIITNWLRIPQISTGHILRSEIAQNTPVGKRAKALVEVGALVDDATTNGLVANRIRLPDCRDGFILDGYPRNLQQAAALGRELQPDDRLLVIDIVTDLERIVERLMRRLSCKTCGADCNSMTTPCESASCECCGSVLVRRSDDRADVIRSRFETYRVETLPLIESYKTSGAYHSVDGMQPPSLVAEGIAAILRNRETNPINSSSNEVSPMRVVLILALMVLITACSAGRSGRTDSPARSTDPKTITNPVAATPESIAAGKKLYERLCSNCHGVAGNGVSETAAKLVEAGKPKPSDLTDDKWDYGSTDGEIFVAIRDGVGTDAAMRGLNGKPGVGPNEMWRLVNYVRSIGPRP